MSSGATATEHQPGQGSAGLARFKEQLRGNPLVALLIAGAASIAVIVALLMWASSPDYRVLYSNLSEADGGSIINELDTRGIPYRFSEGGQALLVPADQVHTLRLQLAEQGLPRGGNVGFELMENQAFGISQFAEQINYQRGLEGELSRSMESLGPVNRARVHLALAKDSVFVRNREPAKASVVLSLHPGRTLGEGQVNAIVHMVASSVPELAAEAVTVVDQNGRLLTSPEANGLGLDGTQLDYIAEVERSYQRRIESILTPLLGGQNVKAQVTAQVDFSRREETSERYGPNQPPNAAAVRSRQNSVDYRSADDLAGGIPGALSNTPPGSAPSPVENPPDPGANANNAGANTNTAADQANADNNAAMRSINRDEVVNYEVDRSISHVEHRRGQVERLSAAVVVNYRPVADDQGVMQPTPLSEVEINQIEQLVRQAMGFSQARGDEIAVVNSPFTRTTPKIEPLPWWQQPDLQQLALTLGRYLLVALAVLLLYLLILRPLVRRASQAPQPSANASTFQVKVGEDDKEPESAVGKQDESPYGKPRHKRKASGYEDNLNDLREMAKEDPRMVAMIVRGWMNQHD